MTDLDLRLAAARQVADALLYEGYVLYPYRASAQKNQCRWQFGVLVPSGSDPSERSDMRTEVVVVGPAAARLHVRMRALQVQARTIEDLGGEPARLDVDGELWADFDEAVEHQVDLADLPLAGLDRRCELHWPGAAITDTIATRAGAVVGRVVRRRWPVDACLEVRAVPAGPGLHRVVVSVANVGPAVAAAAGRDDVVRRSLVALHLLLAVDGATFASAVDPPPAAEAAVRECRNEGAHPALVDDGLVLSSPIIVADRPSVARESGGDMFDATEIDEILALRVLTLTDEEKREARATDPRAAGVIDRCEAMGRDELAALHGTFRPVDPSPGTVVVGGAEVGCGTRVVLRPSGRADAQDLFIAGWVATVERVVHDVDGRVHLAVVVEDDPGADLCRAEGRYRWFAPDEVEVIGGPG